MPENNKYTFEDVLRYLDGELSDSESADFERALETDTELRQQVEEVRQLIAGAVLTGEQESAAEIRKIHKHFKESGFLEELRSRAGAARRRRISILTRNRLIAAAAIVLILIVAGVFLMRPTQSELLFADYYTPDSVFVLERIDFLSRTSFAAADKPRRDSLRMALEHYNKGAYARAIASLESYLETYGDDDTALLYLGLSRMGEHDFDEAIDVLSQATDSPDDQVKDIAQWSLGLAYLKTNQKEKSQQIFTEISGDDASPYQSRADDILSKLTR